MMKKMDARNPRGLRPRLFTREFKERVKLTVKWQGYPINVLRLPYPPQEEMQSEQDEFKPRRLLLNPALVVQSRREQLVSKFDPPIEIQIAYTRVDLKFAQEHGLEYPQAGFWDGCKWVLFTQEKHQLTYRKRRRNDAAAIAGYLLVKFSEWADPALGMGP